MFDRRGKMLCDKCQCPMKALHVEVGRATFQCENAECGALLDLSWCTERAKFYADSPNKWKYR